MALLLFVPDPVANLDFIAESAGVLLFRDCTVELLDFTFRLAAVPVLFPLAVVFLLEFIG